MSFDDFNDIIDWCRKNVKPPATNPKIGEIKVMNMLSGFRVTIAFIGSNPSVYVPVVVIRFDVDSKGEIIDKREMTVQ